MTKLMTAIDRLVLRDEGQDILEYGLLVALIAVVAIVGITSVGNTIQTVFWSSIGQAI
jgi:pilus assembly protein Flp/PilA